MSSPQRGSCKMVRSSFIRSHSLHVGDGDVVTVVVNETKRSFAQSVRK